MATATIQIYSILDSSMVFVPTTAVGNITSATAINKNFLGDPYVVYSTVYTTSPAKFGSTVKITASATQSASRAFTCYIGMGGILRKVIVTIASSAANGTALLEGEGKVDFIFVSPPTLND